MPERFGEQEVASPEAGEKGASEAERHEATLTAPEEETGRSFEERLHQVSRRATGRAALLERERFGEYYEGLEAKDVFRNLPPLLTLEAVKAEWEALPKEAPSMTGRFKALLRRLGGREPQPGLEPLLFYLEKNLPDVESVDMTVDKGKVDAVVRKYERQGYRVDVFPDEAGKESIYARRETPYRPSAEELRRLPALIGKASDPVEVIERLKRLGFYTTAALVRSRSDFERLCEFVSSPEINEFLKKCEALGMRVERSYERPEEKVKQFIEAGNLERLTDETLRKMAVLKQALGLSLSIEETASRFEVLLEFAEDENTFALGTFLGVEMKGRRDDGLKAFYNLVDLKKAGLTTRLGELVRANPFFAKGLLAEFTGREGVSFWRNEQNLGERLQSFLDAQKTRELLENPERTQFVSRVALLMGEERFPFENLEVYAALQKHPEALAFFESVRACGLPLGKTNVERGVNLERADGLLKERVVAETVVSPEFQTFIERLKRVGYAARFDDLYFYDSGRSVLPIGADIPGGQLIGLFHTPEWRDGIAGEEGAALIKRFGNFDMRSVSFYTALLRTPRALAALEGLEKFFGYGGEQFRAEFNEASFREFCASEEIKAKVFNPEAASFVAELKGSVGYQFRFSDASLLAVLSGNPGVREAMLDPANGAFIRECARYQTLAELQVLAAFPEAKKRLIAKFHEDFDYVLPSIEEIARGVGMEVLVDDSELARAAKENNERQYQALLVIRAGNDFIDGSDWAQHALETMKEKEWLAIQTYNRLYAARRSRMGFDTYAYHAREGAGHPTINVTSYGDTFHRGRSPVTDLEVIGPEDAEGFIPGLIQGRVPEMLRLYPRNYALYKKALDQFRALKDEDEKEAFFKRFSWYVKPKRFPKDPEFERVFNEALPIGIAENGHSHYYATPYSLVSGCISQSPWVSGMFEKEHVGSLGVDIVTGHKEMLADFLAKQEARVSTREQPGYRGRGVVRVDFEGVELPPKLKEMVLPPRVTVGEVLLNLHAQQYFSLERDAVNADLLTELIGDVKRGRVRIFSGGQELAIDAVVPPDATVVLKKVAPASRARRPRQTGDLGERAA